MKINEMAEIVGAICYKPGWRVLFDPGTYNRPFIQIEVTEEAPEARSPMHPGARTPWKGGKVFLSSFMCRQEIVGAVFGAIRAAEEHEMREWFTYKGARIFNPHLDPDRLAEFARKADNFDFRMDAMSMTEATGGVA